VDSDQIKVCIREVLEERTVIDSETHRVHHECLSKILPALIEFLEYRKTRMEQVKKRDEMIERMRNTAIGAGVVAVVGGVVALLGWIGAVVWHAIAVSATQNGGN
jgi:hypothetical protein